LLLRVSAIVLCALLFAGLCAARAAAATILVIQSYHAEYAWDAEWLQTLRLRLTPEHTLLTFELDTKRLPREEFAARAGLAMDAYRRHAPDVVVLADDNACRLLGRSLCRQVRVLFTWGSTATRAITGCTGRKTWQESSSVRW
jgi:hypothetical protein